MASGELKKEKVIYVTSSNDVYMIIRNKFWILIRALRNTTDGVRRKLSSLEYLKLLGTL